MYEITKSPIALQIALQLLPLVHSPPPADGCAPVQQQPRDRFRPPPLFDGCVTLRHQWERLARADGSAIMTTASETAPYPERNRAGRSARRSARHRHHMSAEGRGDPSYSMQVTRVAPDWPAPSLMHGRRVLGDRIVCRA
jgi:hypothetical protein